MENKVRFKLHKVKKHWITIAASSLAIGASLIGLGQVGADEVKPETTAVTSPENVVSDSNLETSANLITRTEVAPASTTVEKASSEAVSSDTAYTNATSQPTETTTTQPANETDKKVEAAQSGETATTDRSVETSSETSDNVTTSQETPSQGGRFTSDEQGNWYYLDSEGHKLTGPQTIDSFNLYFHNNGIQAKGEKVTIDGKDYYYDKDNGRKVTDTSIEVDGKTYLADADGILTEKTQLPTQVVTGGHFQSDNQKDWYYYTANGEKLTGWQNVDGVILYFDKDGKQVKGNFAENGAYYDENSGVQVTNRYVNFNNNWYRIGAKGTPLKGAHVVDGHNVFFDQDGKQIKGDFASDGYYYSKNSGDRVDLGQNHYQNINNNWYYIGNDGKRLTGEQVIDGVEVYFDSTGKQVKGNFAENDSFYDKDSGARLKEQFVDLNGKTYYVDAKGKRLREGGVRTINGKEYTFTGGADPHLAREEFLYPYGYSSFYDLNNKEVKGPQFVKAKNGNRYYITASGHVPLGLHIINGELYMFDAPTNKYADGRVSANGLTKDYFPSLIPNGSHIYYFDKETATAIKNQYKEVNGNWYYFGPNWYALTGEQTIDGAHVYFHRDGKQAKGELVTVNDKLHYYDPNSGARTENTTLTIEGKTYHFDAEGNGKLLN